MREKSVILRPGDKASIMGKLRAVGCIIRRPEAEVSVTKSPEAGVSVNQRLESEAVSTPATWPHQSPVLSPPAAYAGGREHIGEGEWAC